MSWYCLVRRQQLERYLLSHYCQHLVGPSAVSIPHFSYYAFALPLIRQRSYTEPHCRYRCSLLLNHHPFHPQYHLTLMKRSRQTFLWACPRLGGRFQNQRSDLHFLTSHAFPLIKEMMLDCWTSLHPWAHQVSYLRRQSHSQSFVHSLSKLYRWQTLHYCLRKGFQIDHFHRSSS